MPACFLDSTLADAARHGGRQRTTGAILERVRHTHRVFTRRAPRTLPPTGGRLQCEIRAGSDRALTFQCPDSVSHQPCWRAGGLRSENPSRSLISRGEPAVNDLLAQGAPLANLRSHPVADLPRTSSWLETTSPIWNLRQCQHPVAHCYFLSGVGDEPTRLSSAVMLETHSRRPRLDANRTTLADRWRPAARHRKHNPSVRVLNSSPGSNRYSTTVLGPTCFRRLYRDRAHTAAFAGRNRVRGHQLHRHRGRDPGRRSARRDELIRAYGAISFSRAPAGASRSNGRR